MVGRGWKVGGGRWRWGRWLNGLVYPIKRYINADLKISPLVLCSYKNNTLKILHSYPRNSRVICLRSLEMSLKVG